MGKPTGFLEYRRAENPCSAPKDRVSDYSDFHFSLPEDQRREQGARCMNCGVPFCQSAFGCPLHNLVPEWNDEGTMTNEEKVLITQSVKEVNQIMANYVGIVRSDLRLHRAWDRLDMLYEETERLFKRVKASKDICELRNMINVGYLITRWALERKECRGLHFTIDYPVHAYDK
jgi:hypothetical protein